MIASAILNSGQLKAIHTLKGKAGLDEACYRDMLAGYGVSSSKHLTVVQANGLIEKLRDAAPGRAHPRAVPMTGRYGAIIRALWIAGWNLGVVRDHSDEAACSFVERQTGVMRTAWLVEPAQGRAAIEALKQWIGREGGVDWPTERDSDTADRKLAVLVAQWQRLKALGVVQPDGPLVSGLLIVVETEVRRELHDLSDPSLTPAELDRVSAILGRRIRKAMGKAS